MMINKLFLTYCPASFASCSNVSYSFEIELFEPFKLFDPCVCSLGKVFGVLGGDFFCIFKRY